MKKHRLIALVIIGTFLAVAACRKKTSQDSQEMTEKASSNSAHYPTQIVAPDAQLTKITAGYSFDTAGSPLYLNGTVYFTNNNFDRPKESRTLRQNKDGSIDTLAMNNGVTTTLRASGKGTIYACQMLGHQVVELDTTGQILNVIATKYKGKRIDGPNDLVVDHKGGVYFSDSQFIAGGQKRQDTPAVYYVDPDGGLHRVIDDIIFPNGLTLSPDGATLYVANTPGKHLLAYDVRADGSVHHKKEFAQLERVEGNEEGRADGMATDTAGNVYVATTNDLGVQVFNSRGDYLGSIGTPTPSNNVGFGGVNNQTLYIAAQDGIYGIKVQGEGL